MEESSRAIEEEENKLPLKRVELSLSKFNEVAIPHHLDLLRQHKANIIKHSGLGEYGRVRAEAGGAARAASRLRALLAELGALRRRVRPADRAAFDALAAPAIRDTSAAIADYTESSPPVMMQPAPARAMVEEADAGETESVELSVQLQVEAGREREEALRGWSELQEEVRALHETWCAVHDAALAQRGHAARVERSVDAAAEEVAAARAHLALGERLRAGGAALGGAALGALAAGPLGLLVGLKAGAAAALAGSLLGYAAVRRRAPAPLPAPAPAPDDHPRDKDKDA